MRFATPYHTHHALPRCRTLALSLSILLYPPKTGLHQAVSAASRSYGRLFLTAQLAAAVAAADAEATYDACLDLAERIGLEAAVALAREFARDEPRVVTWPPHVVTTLVPGFANGVPHPGEPAPARRRRLY
jgi:hypothetical protein